MSDENDSNNSEDRVKPKRQTKIRDIFTDRIIGIVGGACIPLVLLFIPLINKYLDNAKEIQALEIQSNADDIEDTNQRLSVLTQVIVGSQIQLKSLTEQLERSVSDLKKTTESLEDCRRSLGIKRP